MSKAELARKAGVSPLTIDRIEKSESCRMDTKRKIILALGFSLGERHKVFLDDDDELESESGKGRRSDGKKGSARK